MPLMSITKQQKLQSTRLLIIPFILIAALIFSLIIASDYRKVEKKFNFDAEKFHTRFEFYMRQNEAVLEGLSSFISGVGKVDKNILDHYSKKIKARVPHIYMLEVAEEVKGINLKKYIENKRAEGIVGFDIKAFDHTGDRKWAKYKNKEKYFPLIYLYPETVETKNVFGLDLTSNKNFKVSLNKALSSGSYITSLPFELIEGGKAFIMFKKVDLTNNPVAFISLIIITADDFILDLRGLDDSLGVLIYHNLKSKTDISSHFILKDNQKNRWLPSIYFESTLEKDKIGLILQVTKQFEFTDINWILLLVISQILLSLYFVIRSTLIKNNAIQSKLQKASQQKYKMEAISNLTGGIAHEFNNNLSVTRGFLCLLSEKNNDENVTSWIKHIEAATEKSINLTRKLLTYSRYGGIRERVSNIVISKEINRIKVELSNLVNKNVELKYELTDYLHTVLLSEADLKEILFELVTNANAAIGETDGLITISIKTKYLTNSDDLATDHNINVIAGEYIQLSVSDNGKGIDSTIKPHIFDPFFTTKEFGQSSGMGLASVYGLVKLSNGYISCSSNNAKGAALNIYLPILN